MLHQCGCHHGTIAPRIRLSFTTLDVKVQVTRVPMGQPSDRLGLCPATIVRLEVIETVVLSMDAVRIPRWNGSKADGAVRVRECPLEWSGEKAQPPRYQVGKVPVKVVESWHMCSGWR